MGLWQFSKTSWKHLRRKYPPSDTALSHFPRENEGWKFTFSLNYISFGVVFFVCLFVKISTPFGQGVAYVIVLFAMN